ncbi:MAG: 3-isopropylmalate dehydratase, partial [Candidatus Cloacimonetes bacterium]|nr:3-isopropylmalate dehydratase [Candidatus Cloacimonadota bacterium]
FGAIYKRNAINSGLPILQIKEIDLQRFNQREEIEINLVDGSTNSKYLVIEPFSKVQKDIYRAGNLFKFGKI